MRRRGLYWILFFVFFAGCVAVFWTTSSVYFYHRYSEVLDQLRGFIDREKLVAITAPLTTMTIILSLGFGVGLLGLMVFFIRLLREMRLSQLQKDFLARISHELQSPVSSLELSGSMLRKQGHELSEAERLSLWEVHDSELRRLRVEIESLLEASRWEHRGFRPHFQSFHLEEWLENAFYGWEKIIGPSGKIQRSGDAFDFRTRLDPRILLLLTNNIVDNSRKYSIDCPLDLKVRTVAKLLENGQLRWEIEFSDNGRGFPPEFSKRIFKKFEKVPDRTPKAGFGVGLFLAKQASKQMGLELTAASPGLGQGATFKIVGQSEMSLLI